MTVPYIYSVTQARVSLSRLVSGVATGDHGPIILGQFAHPRAVLSSWELFDQMRDLLSTLEVHTAVPALAARVQHPSGQTTATAAALTPAGDDQVPVTFWPDVVADLRQAGEQLPAQVVHALEAIAGGELAGQPLLDPRLPGQWAWELALDDTGTAPARGHHLVWRQTDTGREIVAVLPINDVTARAWQNAPDHDTDQPA